jgi:hypothetical protein
MAAFEPFLSLEQFCHHCVTIARPLAHVSVGTRGRDSFHHRDPEYKTINLDRAIFATGWDGDVVVLANTDGAKRVIIN